MITRQQNWWLQTWYCEVCRVTIRKHHRSRHLQGKGHLARSMSEGPLLASDLAFASFLATFDARRFAGLELIIYRQQKELIYNGQSQPV